MKREWMLLALLAAAFVAPALAQDAPKHMEEEKTGIKIGEKAPDFKLVGQDDKEQSLSDFLKKGKVAIFFQRSAEW